MRCQGRGGGLGQVGRAAPGWLYLLASWRFEARMANRGECAEMGELEVGVALFLSFPETSS